ncbi:MAG: hypothetical protein M1818_005306 [Claussenomyces sp. TS43310]|nr:MAG: hypothetical protein M1818_005306 [Claussenomyces sp. TS43310]
MRLSAPYLSFFLLLISNPPLVSAIPPVFENLLAAIEKRQCNVPCGQDNQYCCNVGSVCYTDAATIARCAASTTAGSGGGGTVYTTTYVETDLNTITSTWTVFPTPASTSVYLAQSTANCYSPETPCGALCCASNQYCYTSGQCAYYSSISSATYVAPTSSYSAPLRPTSGTTSTTVIAATTTQPFSTPVGTAGGAYGITPTSASHGLSAGAIAGIVIGTIAGIILLALILLFCCAKAVLDRFLTLLGFGKKKPRSTTVKDTTIVEERRYSRYGSGRGSVPASRRETHGGWFGGAARGGRGGGATTVVSERRRSDTKKETGIIGGVALGLAGLYGLLGLKRKRDAAKKPLPPRSELSYDSYTDSYTDETSSSASSDRRTRHSRRP